MNAKHLCLTDSHYTPKVYLDAVREVLGGIDLDPASSQTANETVQATNYFTEDQDGLSQSWYGNVFCNPPSGKRNNQSLPKLFWQKLINNKPDIDHAIFLAFSIEQLQTTQSCTKAMLNFPLCIPNKRIRFVTPDGTPGNSPTHASAFIYVPTSRFNNTAGFYKAFAKFGSVVLPR